jgi:mitochondrial fission protein ELM1
VNDHQSDDGLIIPSARQGDGEKAEQELPRVWLLLGTRLGDNNQVLALAQALGFPFEAKSLTYNGLRYLPFTHRRGLAIVARSSRPLIAPPWPDLVIGVGYNSLPVARHIRHRSRGHTRLVQIGNLRAATRDLDLVITTPQFSAVDAPNVLALPFPIGNPARSVSPTREEEQWLRALPHPRRLVAVGGRTRKWKIDNAELDRVIRRLQHLSASEGGSVVAVTSPRTTQATRRLLEGLLARETDALVDDFPRFAVLLARCDEFYVTADSVSMLSEAILTGNPVAMIAIGRSLRGKIGHRLRGLGFPAHADLSKFWRYLAANKLVGPVEAPVASTVSDTVSIAANAVRRVLGAPTRPSTRP